MKKKLNVDMIQSELRGGSAFFPSYKEGNTPETSAKDAEESPTVDFSLPPGVPPPVPQGEPPLVPLIPKTVRPIKQRQPFDIYEDQYQTLKTIADAEKGFINGRGMSQMVREALDDYFRKHGIPRKA